MLALLYNHPANEITVKEVKEITGIDFQKNGKRYLTNPVIMSAMANRGWQFCSGTSRTNISKFVRN